MGKELFIINGIIIFYLLQRLSEILISRNNEEWLMKNHYAVEANPDEGKSMKLFHALWFISLFIEANLRKSFQPPVLSVFIYAALIICLLVRIHTMDKLKSFWIIKVMDFKNPRIATDGLFKYIRHPNYLIVIAELFLIPFLMKAYVTMIFFGVTNLFIQARRVRLEESILMKHEYYRENFSDKKRFIPYVFMFFLFCIHNSSGGEISRHFKNYAEAHTSRDFIRFGSESRKIGFVTTGFDGYALDYLINYEINGNQLQKLLVKIDSRTLDTDNSARNDKMTGQILESDNYPAILAESNELISMEEGEKTINFTYTIKGKKIIRPASITIKKAGQEYLISGKSSIKLSEAGLPDPSIFIAKVRDEFDLTFALAMKI